MQVRKVTPPGVLRGSIKPNTWDPETREIEFVISTGAAGRRWDWRTGEEYIEELDVSGCNLSRIVEAGPLLLDHDASIESVAGRFFEARVEDSKIWGRAKISERAKILDMTADIVSGVIGCDSVGYTVEREEIIKEDGQLERRVAREWTIWEVSLVAIPFDAGASTRSAAQPQQRQENTGMSQTQTPVAEPVAQPAPDLKAIRAAETDRQNKVRAAAAKFRLAESVVTEILAETDTYEAAAAKVMERAVTADVATAQVSTHRVDMTRSGQDDQMGALTDALEFRAGLIREPTQRMRELVRETSIAGIGRQFLEARGFSPQGMGRRELFRASLASHNPLTERSAVAPHTVSDFPSALEFLGKKILMQAYNAEPKLFDEFATRQDFNSLREEKLVATGAFPDMVKTPEGGTVQYGTVTDRGETYSCAKYTTGVKLTEEIFINDDIGLVMRTLAGMGETAVANEKQIVFNLFLNNPAMSDGNDVFSAAHNNVGTAGAISIATIGELRNLIRSQLKEGSTTQRVYAEPRFLLVPSDYETLAEQVISPNLIGSTAAAPASIQKFKILAEPRLNETGNSPWYLLAANCGIYYGYLQERPGPSMRQVLDQLDMSMTLVVDEFFGATVGDWRGMAKNPYA
jgi:hypothetical protein